MYGISTAQTLSFNQTHQTSTVICKLRLFFISLHPSFSQYLPR